MIRPAVAGDEGRIDAFLADHPNSSMFLRSNLASRGIGDLEHPHGTEFLLQFHGDELRGVFGLTNEGYGLCQAPDADPALWAGFAAHFNGRAIKGLTGPDSQVIAAITAMGLPQDAFALNHAEPLYRLELDQLAGGQGQIRKPGAQDIELLTLWYAGYANDTGLKPTGDAATAAIERAVNAIKGDNTRLLIEAGKPVATSSINARFAEMVQIGGVYTPPDQRGKGYGRHVVAAQLAEARGQGANTAILFSNNDAASRAYEAIGFRRVGSYRVAILRQPQQIGASP